jgi:hypothetical protein
MSMTRSSYFNLIPSRSARMFPRLSRPPPSTPHHSSLALLALALALGPSPARAQWSVIDERANDMLETANERLKSATDVLGTPGDANGATINRSIHLLDRRFDIGISDSPGARVEDPPQPLVEMQLANDTDKCGRVADSQQAVCTELVKTKTAQYMYMKTMYDITGTRHRRLTELVNARSQLATTDYGKLEDNTNQILALETLAVLDRQQMEAAHHAYQARIDYLNNQLTQQANAATRGTPTGGLGSLAGSIGGIVSGAVLKAALDTSRRASAPGRLTLGIDR